jgi:hypothetical protein
MANLNGLGIDPDVKESTGEFIVIPEGQYQAVILADELTENKAGTGKLLILQLQIIEGKFTGHEIIDRLNILNQSVKAQSIAQGTLKRICNCCNVQFPPSDTRKMYGIPMTITVAVEDFESNTTGKMLQNNKVKKYDPAGTKAKPATTSPPPATDDSGGTW